MGIKKSEHRILLAFLLNLIFSFVEVWGSIVTGSVTIFSDAIHDFGDCVALGIAWRMEKISKKAANEKYQFGYRRFSVLAGLINNLILLAGGVIIIVTSVQRVLCPREIDGAEMLMFAVFGILMNGAAMLLTAKGKNINEKTISIHMLEDVLTWVAVLLVGGVMCFFELPVLDSVLSVGMTAVIFVGVAKNLKRIFAVLAVKSPLSAECYLRLKKDLAGCENGMLVEELRIFSMDGEDRLAEVCLLLDTDRSAEEQTLLMKRAKECCEAYGICQTIVQMRYEIK
ncbi:MAG: cation transporter [Lachnospiraceae bacterium]|nr:cation transporter [Lachnospiraceae bacterium]